jgi:PAS domain S-box-containing protein
MSRNLYRELFEHSADAILIIKNGRFVDCNPATLDMLGYKQKEEFLNTHPSELSPKFQPDGRLSYEKADEMMKNAMEEGSKRFEWEHVRANGEVFPVEVLLTPINSYQGAFLHVVWRDITERKSKEKELQANYELLSSIIENQPTCLKMVDRDGVLLDMNPAGLAMICAKSKDKVIGESVLNLIAEEDRQRFAEFNQKICSGEKGELEFKMQDLNGGVHYMETLAVPLKFGPKNELVQLAITRDMTHHLQNEHEKQNLTNRLKQAQKMEAIGNLAGGIAHDFNNILTAILGYAELALATNLIEDELLEDINEIKKAGTRAKELVKQILAFSRQIENQKHPVQIDLIIKEVLKLLRASIPATIEIKSYTAPDCGIIMADSTQVHQVLMNLCTNSYHAMREDGGTLAVNVKRVNIDKEDPKVSMLHFNPGPYVSIEVSDTGYGMSENTLERIFEPYFTTKKKGEGTGMGLAVVHGIVKDHGGDISVYSEEGCGTTFQLFFPAQETDNVEESDLVKDIIVGGNENILFVDDDATIVKLGIRMLSALGYKVTGVTSPEEALDKFASGPDNFDLVITDMTMPHMTGAELAQGLLAIDSALPIILCTGFSEIINKQKALKLGIKAYAMKPIVRSDIAKLIRKVLDEKTFVKDYVI